MLKLLLLRFWPIWLPLALYLLWWYVQLLRAKRRDDVAPRLQDGPWLWTVMASLGMAIIMFLWLGLSMEATPSGNYQPAQNVGGDIVKP
jgi:H+/Cl- antiporter ClcA